MNSNKLILIIGLLLSCLKIHATVLEYPSTIERFSDSLMIDNTELKPRNFGDLNETYTGEDFIYERTVENSGWWTRFKQWLSDLIKGWFDMQNSDEAYNLTDLMLKTGGVIIFLLVVYFIFKAVMNNEGQWVFGKSSDKNIIPVTDIESNLSITDFNKLTKQAENNEEFRLAVRYYYLWLLKRLSNFEIIEYDVDKTNSDYYNEISLKEVKDQFSYASYLYNYIWYGEFNVNEVDFKKAKKTFVQFINSIKE